MVAIFESDALSANALRNAAGEAATTVATFEALGLRSGQVAPHATIVIGPSLDTEAALGFAETIRRADPTCGVLLVRHRVDTTVMGAAMAAGVREVVAERELGLLTAAVQRSERQTAALRGSEVGVDDTPARAGRVVSVWSPKGGCGKTTIATNVAVSLAQAGHRVLLLDLDLAFGDVAIALGLRPQHSFDEVAAMGERIDRSALNGLLTEHESGLFVLSPPNEPGITERISTALAARLIEVARTDADYVVIDSAPVLDERNIAVLEASDVVLVPTILDIPSLKNLRVGIDTLRLINFPIDRLKIVLNRGDVKVGLNPAEVSKSLGLPVVAKIPSSLEVTAVTNRGVALVAENPKNPVALALAALVDSVVLKPEHARSARSTRLPWKRSA